MCKCGVEPDTTVENIQVGRTNQLAVVCQQCREVIDRIDG